jgi:CheY-like chemotaxis protein
MLRDGFDERFRAAGARSFFFSPVRLAMAGVLWAVLGLGAGWPVAGFWVAAVLLAEWPMRELTRPMARGLDLSRIEAFLCVAVYGVAVCAWSSAGAILWSSNHVACQLAAVGFFAGHLFYLNSCHGRSMGALVPALPGLMAPAIAPLVAPHYRGVDQILVEATMLAAVAQAAISIAVNFHEARRLTGAGAASSRGEERAVASPAANAAHAQAVGWSRPLRVLVAEDNAVNQLVLKTLLAQVGVQPEIVSDGQAAVDAWTREPWDLILMDVQMPGMDGPAAARAIRAAEVKSGRAHTPIVALTGAASSQQVTAYADAGMNTHVTKPIEAAALFAALQVVGAPADRGGRNTAAA